MVTLTSELLKALQTTSLAELATGYKGPHLATNETYDLEVFKANIRKYHVWHDIDVSTADFILDRYLTLTNAVNAKNKLLSVYYFVLLLSYCRQEQHSCLPHEIIVDKLTSILVDCAIRTAPNSAQSDAYLYNCVKNFLDGETIVPSSKLNSCFYKLALDWQTPEFIATLVNVGLMEVKNGTQVSIPHAPLIFSENSFYIARSFWYEFKVASTLRQELGLCSINKAIDKELPDNLPRLLDLFFPKANDVHLPFGVNWQKIAVAEALRHRFSVITGGPGTGKTTSVAKLVSILMALNKDNDKELRLGLAAPTGKAADRMVQSFRKNFMPAANNQLISMFTEALGCKASVIMESFKELKAVTVQAMLGLNPSTTLCKYNSTQKLPFDVIIVDEASMIDLENFSRLIEATDDHTRLVFLGDRDQLASVDAGSVLGDICSILRRNLSSLSNALVKLLKDEELYLAKVTGYTPLDMKQSALFYNGSVQHVSDPVIVSPGLGTLLHSYRFKADSAIGVLARNINSTKDFSMSKMVEQGVALQFEKLADFATYLANNNISEKMPALWVSSLKQNEARLVAEFIFAQCIFNWLDKVIQAQGIPDSVDLFVGFNAFRVLTPVNDGIFGVQALNKEILNRALCYIKNNLKDKAQDMDASWFVGLPYMITKNNRELGVFNGDIGICVYDNAGRKVIAFEDGRMLFPSMLPDVVPAFVLTIHKSQGSEFDHTLVLVPDYAKRLLCKELIYTAVTRAKKLVSIFGSVDSIDTACGHNCVRFSGLNKRLYDEI